MDALKDFGIESKNERITVKWTQSIQDEQWVWHHDEICIRIFPRPFTSLKTPAITINPPVPPTQRSQIDWRIHKLPDNKSYYELILPMLSIVPADEPDISCSWQLFDNEISSYSVQIGYFDESGQFVVSPYVDIIGDITQENSIPPRPITADVRELPTNQHQVFISYRRGTDKVRKLVDDLRTHDFRVWFDKDDIPGYADDWWHEIQKGIAQSQAVVLCATREAVTRQVIQWEIYTAKALNKPIFLLMFEGDDSHYNEIINALPVSGRQQIENFTKTDDWGRNVNKLISDFAKIGIIPEQNPVCKPSTKPTGTWIPETTFEDTIDALTNTQSIAVFGPSGVGKTEYALQVMRRLSTEDLQIIWLRVGTVSAAAGFDPAPLLYQLAKCLLTRQQLSFFQAQNSFENRKLYLSTQLEKHNQQIIIFADDVYTVEQLDGFIVDESHVSYLLTTPNVLVAANRSWQTRQLTIWSDTSEKLSNLKQLAGHIPEKFDDKLRQLLQYTSSPQDIALLASRLRIATLTMIEEDIEAILQEFEQTKFKTDIEEFGSIVLIVEALSEAAKTLLWAICHLPSEPNDIPRFILELSFANDDNSHWRELLHNSLIRAKLGGNRFEVFSRVAAYLQSDNFAYMNASDIIKKLVIKFVEFAERYARDFKTDFELFDVEYHNLIATTELAVAYEFHDLLLRSINSQYEYWKARGYQSTMAHFFATGESVIEQVADGDLKAHFYMSLSKWHVNQIDGNLEQAHEYIKRAMEMHSLGDELGILIYSHRGAIEKRLGEFALSQEFYLQALEWTHGQSSSNYERLVTLNNQLGNLARDLARNTDDSDRLSIIAEALDYYDTAVQYADEHELHEPLLQTLQNLARLQIDQRDFDAAKTTLNRAETITAKITNPILTNEIRNTRGHLHLDQASDADDLNTAQSMFEAILAQSKEFGDIENIIANLLGLAEIAIKLENFADAEEKLITALHMKRVVEDRRYLEAVIYIYGDLIEARINASAISDISLHGWQQIQQAITESDFDLIEATNFTTDQIDQIRNLMDSDT